MKRSYKTKHSNRFAALLLGKEGASIVLVTIISIIIITGVIVLRITSSALWASADKQLNQDQAYEMATSLGNSLDKLIISNKSIDLSAISTSGGEIIPVTSVPDLPDAIVFANVKPLSDEANNRVYIVTVQAKVANTTYEFSAQYSGSGTNYQRLY